MKSRDEPTLDQGDKGAAGPESKQGKTDDHVREMVPLHDGKQPHQEDFITDDSCGDKENGIPKEHVNDHL